MVDFDLIKEFEACTLPEEKFHHKDHLRLSWSYLKQMPLPEAMIKMREGLKRYATAKGKANLYHETITMSYLVLLSERMAKSSDEDWGPFSSKNADLFQWKPGILNRYYSEELLCSPLARATFVWPDLGK